MADEGTPTGDGGEDTPTSPDTWDVDGPAPDKVAESIRDLGVEDHSLPDKPESKPGESAPKEVSPEDGEPPKIKIGEKEYEAKYLEEILGKADNMDAHFTKTNQTNAELRRRLETEVHQATLLRRDLDERVKAAAPKAEPTGPGRHEQDYKKRGYDDDSPELLQARALDQLQAENAALRADTRALKEAQDGFRRERQDGRDLEQFRGKLSTLYTENSFAKDVPIPKEMQPVIENFLAYHGDTTVENTPEMFKKIHGLLQSAYKLGVKVTSDSITKSPRGKGREGLPPDSTTPPKRQIKEPPGEEPDDLFDKGKIREEVKDGIAGW